MAAFAFIHGAGDAGWDWHLVAAELESRGHSAVPPALPGDDASPGLPEYADTVAAAARELVGERAGDQPALIVVAQSLGGFVAPLVCDRVPVALLVLVAPMIPAPGASWPAAGYADEPREHYDDTVALFYQDVPPELAAAARTRSRGQSEARM